MTQISLGTLDRNHVIVTKQAMQKLALLFPQVTAQDDVVLSRRLESPELARKQWRVPGRKGYFFMSTPKLVAEFRYKEPNTAGDVTTIEVVNYHLVSELRSFLSRVLAK